MEEKNFVVYRSSAGSGKTYSLVKEYLKIVLNDTENYIRTLAITFTNKAANEMKIRVMNSLHNFVVFNSDEDKKTKALLDDIAAETGITIDRIIKNAAIVQQKILHNYSDFHISTIDSFVQKIIRSFATDLRLSADYEISLDDRSLLYEAVDAVVSLTNKEADITQALVKFVEYKTDDDKSWDIDKEIKQFASNLLSENFHDNMESVMNLSVKDFVAIISRVSENIKKIEESVLSLSSNALKIINSKGLVFKDFYHGAQGIPVYFRRFVDNNFSFEAKTYVMNAIEEDIWYAKTASVNAKNAIDEIKDELRDLFVKIDSVKNTYVTCNVVRKNLYPLALLNEIEKAYNEIKSSNNIVAISDFNKIISGIVSKEPVPFVYERIGEKYEHYLIDEFQDTSVLQWNNLLPLIHNALSKGKFNMLVGDAKQAIYRFRGGDVDQFVNLPGISKKIFQYNPEEEKALLSSLKDNFNEKFLKVNYRSRKEIVEFNNDFFKHLSENIAEDGSYIDFKKVYESVYQEVKTDNLGGFISLEFIDTENNKEEDQNLSRIKEITEDLLNSGFKLKDIAVLCRKNKDANEVARYLISNDIKVISSESLLLSGSDDVKFIIDLTIFLTNQTNMVARSSVIEYMMNIGKLTGVFNDHTAAVSSADPIAFLELIRQNDKPFNPEELSKLPYYELVEELIMYFGLNAPDPYIQHFLDCALEFTTGTNRGFNDFLSWWEENKNKRSVVIPEGINAIRIMTIHKSKGLEFPIVIFPYANEKVDLKRSFDFVDFNNDYFPEIKKILVRLSKNELEGTEFMEKYSEEEQKYLLDMINLLYVTLTRATERLYILSNKFKTEKVTKLDSLPKFFWNYLVNKGLWNEETLSYEFGTKELCVDDKKQRQVNEPENVFMDRIISSDWKKNIGIRYKAPEFWDLDDPEKNKNWGNLIHYVLASIENMGEVETVVEKLKVDGVISDENNELVRQKVLEVINHPEISSFFELGKIVRSENEIIEKNGDSHRPDRLVLEGKKAVIIDYKTGSMREYHKDQVNKYAELLFDLGYEEICKYLVYINEEVNVVTF